MQNCFTATMLPKDEFVWEWAKKQTELSLKYKTDGKGMTSTTCGRRQKREMMSALDEAFRTRANAELRSEYIRTYRNLFYKHLEDPGTFENFRFFNVPDSDEMIMFYLSIWTGNMGDAMLYLHFYGKDLKGNYRKTPIIGSSWRKMAENEGIAINERIKAESVAKEIFNHNAKKICFFGGGSLPERLYEHCLVGRDVTIFETSPVNSAEILKNPAEAAPKSLSIISDSLLRAKTYSELEKSQDLVVMHGVSMYLGKDSENMAAALDNARFILRSNGVMMFDYLLMTAGMIRTATAQHWPGAEKMLIFETPKDAIIEANHVISLANDLSPSHFRLVSLEITEGPASNCSIWGPTSVRIKLEKT